MKKIIGVICVMACIGFSSCELLGPPLEIVVSYAASQYEGITDNEFPVLFPPAADIATLQGTVPDAEIASHGPVSGGTLAVVNVTSNRRFFITGVRIENVRYRLSPADGNPIGTSSHIEYIHPTFGVMSPIIPNLGLDPEAESAVIEIPADSTQVFEIGIASALSMWETIDADRDGTDFPNDDDEEIEITCSLFFEGYLEWGIEFFRSFPPPLLLTVIVKHDV